MTTREEAASLAADHKFFSSISWDFDSDCPSWFSQHWLAQWNLNSYLKAGTISVSPVTITVPNLVPLVCSKCSVRTKHMLFCSYETHSINRQFLRVRSSTASTFVLRTNSLDIFGKAAGSHLSTWNLDRMLCILGSWRFLSAQLRLHLHNPFYFLLG